MFAETLAEGCTGALKPSDLHVPHWTEPIRASCLRSDRDQKVREDGDDDIFSFCFLVQVVSSHACTHVFFDVVVVLHVMYVFIMCRRFVIQ